MKPLIIFCLQFILGGMLSFSIAQTHIVKIQTLETIQVNPSDTVIEIEDGKDLLLDVKLSALWFGANLVATANGTNIETQKIDKENFKVKVEKITEDVEVVFSMESSYIEGEIVYDEEMLDLSLRFYILRDLDSFFCTRYKKVNNDWIVDRKYIEEVIPSPDKLRNDELERTLDLWMDDAGMSVDIEYYVTVEYFRYYRGEHVIITTITSPVFTLNEYPVSNVPLNLPSTIILTSPNAIHIQTNNYPCQAQIYTIAGKLIESKQLVASDTLFSIPPGMYVIVVGKERFKVLVK